MIRLRVEANGKQRLLLTDAKTVEGLWVAVERKLDVRIAKLTMGRAVIEDDEDVLALKTDDELQAEVLPTEQEPLERGPFFFFFFSLFFVFFFFLPPFLRGTARISSMKTSGKALECRRRLTLSSEIPAESRRG